MTDASDDGGQSAAGPGNRSDSFARAVYRIASSFVSLDSTDTIIDTALQALGEVCGAGRAYVFLFDDAEETMDNTHEWCSPGVEPQIEMLTDLPVAMFPWWVAKLRNNETILVEDVSQMPPEATAEREILEEQDIKSVLVLPIHREERLAGFIGLDDVTSPGTWEAESQEYLTVAANMVTSTLTRQRRADETVRRAAELETAYENLKETQHKLIQAEKLAGIGLLAAGVAHEINNPVGYLKSNAETLEEYLTTLTEFIGAARGGTDAATLAHRAEELDLDYLLEDAADIIRSNNEGLNRIARIVQSLMGYARNDEMGEDARANVNHAIDNALAVSASKIKNVATVDYQPGDLPDIRCNINELHQVFLNVIFNAAQAVEEDGSDEIGMITIRTSREGEFVHCRFDDTGTGISPEAASRLFEPFYTTKETGKGTGLGMSVVYDIVVNKHHGEIAVTNNEAGGASIEIILPIDGPRP